MKIAMLLSGGVDSSVALQLLKQEGHDITAFYLKIWLEDELAYLGNCPWQEDLKYVEAVCKKLDVPLEVVSLQREYWDKIVKYPIDEVKEGRTPNPDILCNNRIKFGAFLDKIDPSFDKVASGHYARVVKENNSVRLVQSPDPVKDQTYFLAYLTQEQLQRALFPIGHLEKAQVREYAHQFDLPNKDRKDSQGICFLGKLKFEAFLKHHLGEQKGSLVEVETGALMGNHNGFWYYTIGQRQGLGLAGGPWYVVAKDAASNTIYISRNYYTKDKKRSMFHVANCNWIAGVPPKNSPLTVKIRHGVHKHPATITLESQKEALVHLEQRDQGIAPGQFAAFYDESVCLGSGIITMACD